MKIEEINKKQIWEIIRPIEELKKDCYNLFSSLKISEQTQLSEWKHNILSLSSKIEFEEKEHRYFYDGEECISVSNICHLFQQESDFDKIAQNYVRKHNLPISWERLRQIWKLKANQSTIVGTFVHQYGEDLTKIITDSVYESPIKKFNTENGYLFPLNNKSIAIYKYFEWLISNKELPFLAEIKLVLKEHKITGTFDQLVYSIPKRGLIIRDYKTNETLVSDFKKPLKFPFQQFNDENLSIYIIQQNLYSLMLKKELGIEIKGKELVWLKENGQFDIVTLPNIEELIEKGIQSLY